MSYIVFNVVEETLFFALEDNILRYFLNEEGKVRYTAIDISI
jgi:hypothetical protein